MSVTPTRRRSDLRQARELLVNLTKKEVKVRYKGSFLGIAWSLVTPLAMTAIFTVVFATFLRIPVHHFATYFLAGYLIWQFFANSVMASTTAITSNGSLIKKVYFPREVLPVSLVLAQGFHLLIALVAVSPVFVWQRGNIAPYAVAVLGGVVLLVMFTVGVSMLFAALNVWFRDLSELTQVIFLAWFYATPIIYPLYLAVSAGPPTFILAALDANPMRWFAQLFQTALYGAPAPPPAVVTPEQAEAEGWPLPGAAGPSWPDPEVWLRCGIWAVAALLIGWWLFRRLAVTFAKEV